MEDGCLTEENGDNNRNAVAATRKRPFQIEPRYIPLKLLYFFSLAGECCMTIYRALFMRHLGMSTKQTGMIWTLEPVVSVLSPPFIGALTDKTRRPKAVLIVLYILGSITFSVMYFVPQEALIPSGIGLNVTVAEILSGETSFCWDMSSDPASQISTLSNPKENSKRCICNVSAVLSFACDDREDTQRSTASTVISSSTAMNANTSSLYRKCYLAPDNQGLCLDNNQADQLHSSFHKGEVYVANNCSGGQLLCYVSSTTQNDEDVYACSTLVHNQIDEYGVTFWLLVILTLVSSVTVAGVTPVVDATALAVLGKEDRHSFGLQRMWASIGYGIAALIIGYLKDQSTTIDKVSTSNREFLSMFVGTMICWWIAAIVCTKLPVRKEKGNDKVRIKDVKEIFADVKALAFFGILLFYGIDNALQEIYLFWLAEGKLHSPSFVLGIGTSAGAFSSIIFCLLAGYLLRTFGHAPLLCFGLATLGIRTSAPALVTDPWQLVGTESLRGITFGLTWVVICSYTAKISPKGLENSTMGIMQGFVWGAAYSIGSLVGGVIYQSMGGDFLFLLAGLSTLVAATLFGIYSFCARRRDVEGDATESDINEESTKLDLIEDTVDNDERDEHT